MKLLQVASFDLIHNFTHIKVNLLYISHQVCYNKLSMHILQNFTLQRFILKRLLVFLKDYKKESFLAPLFKMLEAIFELLVPTAVTIIIDKGINENNPSVIWLACGFMLLLGIVGLVSALCSFLKNSVFQLFNYR